MLKVIYVLSGLLLLIVAIAAGYFKFLYIAGSKPWLPVTAAAEPSELVLTEPQNLAGNNGPTSELAVAYGKVTRLGDFAHHYSKRQAWNNNESMILGLNGHVFSASGEELLVNTTMTSELVWSNTEPNSIYAIQSVDDINNRFVKWDVATNEVVELYHFSDMTELTIGQWEGTVSNDDGNIVFYGLQNGQPTIVSFSISESRVLGSIDAAANFNWAGVSQRGEWILVENNKYPDPNAQILRYKLDFTEEAVLIEKPNHGDFCIDAAGDEVYAMAGQRLSWVKLATGERFRHSLPPKLYGHISCRALDRPGWAYVSTDNPDGWIGAVPLIANFDRWEPWGMHFSSAGDYKSQPKASVSRSGQAIIFSSDWRGDEVASYEFRLEAESIPNLNWRVTPLKSL